MEVGQGGASEDGKERDGGGRGLKCAFTALREVRGMGRPSWKG